MNFVSGRRQLYRELIALGPVRPELSPFWGFDLQLQWQQASGRLGQGDDIPAESWWGACNFALSVIPYAAAMALKLVPDVALDTRGYERAMPHWHGAFHRLTQLEPDADLEPFRFAIWRAHLASITIAVERNAARLARLPLDEQRFARGWVRMVDLFGAAALRTDREYLDPRPASLPRQILDGNLDQLTRHERSSARRITMLGDRPRYSWPVELAIWKRMMHTRAARDHIDQALADIFGPSKRGKLRALRRLL
ncbi:MAG: Leg1-related protein [Kofleriaceae bacterium]